MNKKSGFLLLAIAISSAFLLLPSCKSCNKSDQSQVVHTDTTATPVTPAPVNNINLPHADTTLIPVLTKVLDEAFDASAKKDYGRLAAQCVYRGTDSTRFGYDVFNAKNNYERNVMRITAAVFNKWNNNVESRDYGRVFALDLPDGRQMPMLEVIFVGKKTIDRKFFGFLLIKDQYKIGDVTSNL